MAAVSQHGTKRRGSKQKITKKPLKGKAKIYIGPTPTNAALDQAIFGKTSSFSDFRPSNGKRTTPDIVKSSKGSHTTKMSDESEKKKSKSKQTRNSPAQSAEARRRWKKLKTVTGESCGQRVTGIGR